MSYFFFEVPDNNAYLTKTLHGFIGKDICISDSVKNDGRDGNLNSIVRKHLLYECFMKIPKNCAHK